MTIRATMTASVLLAIWSFARVAAAEPSSEPPSEQNTAPVETTPTVEPSTNAAPVEDVDWELAAQPTDRYSLDIYGFADFRAQQAFVDPHTGWNAYIERTPQLFVGKLSLYTRADLGDRFSMLGELAFSHLPGGVRVIDGAELTYQSGRVADSTEEQRPVSLGGVSLERLYLEYAIREFAVLQVGQWLTPYGVWNVDHGSPTLIAIRQPYHLIDEILPEHQTGLQLHGAVTVGPGRVGYHLTLSNGRGPVSDVVDLDGNKAVGGRVFLESSGRWGALTLGASAYRGRYTDAKKSLGVNGEGGVTVDKVVLRQYDEQAWTADLKWEWRDVLVVIEAAVNERVYTRRGRPASVPGIEPLPAGAKVPDDRRWGYYGLVAYRTPWANVMPYLSYSGYRFGEDQPLGGVGIGSLGANVRMHPRVVLKAEVGVARFDDAGFISKDDLQVFDCQVAWAF